MTIHQIGFLVWGFYKSRLNFYERRLLHKLLDGISGLEDKSDESVRELLSDKQVDFILTLGKKFHLKNRKEF